MLDNEQFDRVILVYNKFKNDRLLSNSIYLMLATFVMSVTGFVFWLVNTRFHDAGEIGLATTFISVTSLISSLSMFGLNVALVRFLPKEKDKRELINTVFTTLIIVSFLFATAFLIGIKSFSEPMTNIIHAPLSYLLFLLFIPLATLNMITDSVFISYGKAIYTLIINTVMSLIKLGLAIALVKFGLTGILSAFVGSTIFALLASLYCLSTRLDYNFAFKIHWNQVKKMWKFSFGNYVAGLLGSITSMLMPILISSRLSPEVTAYYYMPTMIIALLLTIPRSTVAAMVAEGAREEERLLKLSIKSLAHIYAILIPACFTIFFFGNLVLAAFGKNYSAQGFQYLQLIVVSVMLSVPGFIGGAILNIRKQIRYQFILNLLSAGLSLGLNLFFLSRGLFGLGIASIVYQIIITVAYSVVILLPKWQSRR